MKKYFMVMVAGMVILLTSCKKEAGVGGDAAIQGKVYARHYNSTFTQKLSENYQPDTYVYIIYGDNISYGQRIKTNYKGAFEFKYLYEGDYTIYTYSIDSSAIVSHVIAPPDSAVVKKVTIHNSSEVVDLGDMTVFK